MIKSYTIKAHWNKCDFRARLNAGWLSMLWTAGGRLFHCVGTTSRSERVYRIGSVSNSRITTAALVCDDLSWRRRESAVLNATRSTRYDGHRLCRIIMWCISVAILKMMRYLTGSQCNCWSAGVVCDRRSRLSTSRAAAFCTRCRGARVDAGRPESTELQ